MSINFIMHNKQTTKYIPIKVMPIVYGCFFLLTTACSKLDNKYQAINAPNVHKISVEHMPNKPQEYPLHSVIRDGDLNKLQRLLSTGQANVNAPDEDGRFPLIIATKLGRLDIVQLLLQRDDIKTNIATSDGWTALHFAVVIRRLGIVQALLQRNDIDVNAATSDGWTALHIAEKMGHANIVWELRLHEPINSYQCSAFHAPIWGNDLNELQRLLATDQAARVNIPDSLNFTPLTLAVLYKNLNIVQALLECSYININAATNDGWTALHFAVQMGQIGITQVLLQRDDIDINVITNDGCTAFHFAVQTGQANIFLRHCSLHTQ